MIFHCDHWLSLIQLGKSSFLKYTVSAKCRLQLCEIGSKSTYEWSRVTTSDHEWPRVTTSVTISIYLSAVIMMSLQNQMAAAALIELTGLFLINKLRLTGLRNRESAFVFRRRVHSEALLEFLTEAKTQFDFRCWPTLTIKTSMPMFATNWAMVRWNTVFLLVKIVNRYFEQ